MRYSGSWASGDVCPGPGGGGHRYESDLGIDGEATAEVHVRLLLRLCQRPQVRHQEIRSLHPRQDR